MRLKILAPLVVLGWIAVAQTSMPPPPIVTQSPEQLQQLVAPVALYPDELVAQVLAASTYPAEVVEADRWLQVHTNSKGKDLADEVDKQAWDPSVKALTQFPSVLGNMDKNLSWTSSLGEAYVNQPQQVMDAVQTMRRRAQDAGNLKTTSQQVVKTEGSTVVIQPAIPEVVYVPTYDPWLIYGEVVPVWPGWYWYPGLYWTEPGFGFFVGFEIGFWGGYAWGWNHWDTDWGHRTVIYNHNTYISRSNTFINRRDDVVRNNNFANRGEFRNEGSARGGSGFRSENGFRNEGEARHNDFSRGGGSSAFRGFDHGGVTMDHSSRGSQSFGGGGFHGGGAGGGFHGGGGGGGFHGGGRR